MPEITQRLITSEAVSEGHPDKLADQISDAILDAHLAQDPYARVACETLITTDLIVIAGEITSLATVDEVSIATEVVRRVGYTKTFGFDPTTCHVIVRLNQQSPDIAQGIDTDNQGAGDQGMMIGYACRDTPEFMPLPIMLAQQLIARLTELRHRGSVFLGPDAKAQVSVLYEGFTPKSVEAVVISTQHTDDISQKNLRQYIRENIINAVIPAHWQHSNTKFYINPTGRFVVGGPTGDCGLTGRKIIADTYGGVCPHGGGAFSGKDPSKVDRSAAYMARYAAKHIVAAGLAQVCEVHLAYAIGVAEPVALRVETFGTSQYSSLQLEELLLRTFNFCPAAFIKNLDLRRPIYTQTSVGGHFGNLNFPWEAVDAETRTLMHQLLEKDT